MATVTRSVAYNEKFFRYLLENESQRSEHSGHLYQILLVYHTNEQGAIVPMDSDVAESVIEALSQNLRDTDYIGWYCDELVVGGVLTVVRQESMAQLSSHVQRKMAEVLQSKLPTAENRRLQIRVCQYHELKGTAVEREA